MARRLALAALAVGAVVALPAAPASACASPVCTTVNVVCQKTVRTDCVA